MGWTSGLSPFSGEKSVFEFERTVGKRHYVGIHDIEYDDIKYKDLELYKEFISEIFGKIKTVEKKGAYRKSTVILVDDSEWGEIEHYLYRVLVITKSEFIKEFKKWKKEKSHKIRYEKWVKTQ